MQVLSCKTDTTFGYKWHGQTKHPFQPGKRPYAPPQADVRSVQMLTKFMRDKFLFGLNESFSRFREDIFYRDGQRKPEDPPFTLAFVVSQAVSFEATQQTNKLLAHSSIEEQVHYATSTTPARNSQRPPNRPNSESCFFCGNKTQHPRDICPAQGQTCSYCQKQGHFSSVCQQAIRDQRSSRPPAKKPIIPHPRREHVRMVDQNESLALPPEDEIQYEHCFTISDAKPAPLTHLQQFLTKVTSSYST